MLFGWNGKLNVSRLENLNAPPTVAGVAWTTVLVWFMRLMALVWLLKGLSGWASILGATGDTDAFLNASLMQQTAIVFFAVVDLVAGVGLWMAAGWGGGVWIIAMLAQVMLSAAFPRAISVSLAMTVIYGALILMFLVLAWASAHHEES